MGAIDREGWKRLPRLHPLKDYLDDRDSDGALTFAAAEEAWHRHGAEDRAPDYAVANRLVEIQRMVLARDWVAAREELWLLCSDRMRGRVVHAYQDSPKFKG